ncbi:hypothetical protein NDR87_20355 [Nocardia sp. CDC159]|uniref:Uncharacterized protein n=1 Tax=Nocardia pulmonis TaxID=2951408 RepID=A0A9X2E9L8_9NOCA|nr:MULTISPECIES: hypothetical protein [Nocardia]MCM6776299.1 hypothetical protein [Nocardia pulmonis]MCM6788723.1 hypothetical protein [Nocardia sp. CDC159]
MAVGDDKVILGDGLPADRAAFTVSAPGPEPESQDDVHSRSRMWTRKLLGGPRISTMLLVSVWVALFVLYLQVRPGG